MCYKDKVYAPPVRFFPPFPLPCIAQIITSVLGAGAVVGEEAAVVASVVLAAAVVAAAVKVGGVTEAAAFPWFVASVKGAAAAAVEVASCRAHRLLQIQPLAAAEEEAVVVETAIPTTSAVAIATRTADAADMTATTSLEAAAAAVVVEVEVEVVQRWMGMQGPGLVVQLAKSWRTYPPAPAPILLLPPPPQRRRLRRPWARLWPVVSSPRSVGPPNLLSLPLLLFPPTLIRQRPHHLCL
mmetsp:Transcript_14652/g.42171  ORF Transcript_14652/g.42171 Transcript_14652/m.42171 type:complete len:240 (+) Transcript_14652:32-751(+)